MRCGRRFCITSTSNYPPDKKFSGEVDWVEIDIGKDAVNLAHLIAPEQRLRFAIGTKQKRP
jgi:hypothetical protein